MRTARTLDVSLAFVTVRYKYEANDKRSEGSLICYGKLAVYIGDS